MWLLMCTPRVTLWKGLKLQSVNGGKFEIKQLFAGDPAIVADSEEKFCSLVEFGSILERIKYRVNV